MKCKPNTKAGKLVKINHYQQGGSVSRALGEFDAAPGTYDPRKKDARLELGTGAPDPSRELAEANAEADRQKRKAK